MNPPITSEMVIRGALMLVGRKLRPSPTDLPIYTPLGGVIKTCGDSLLYGCGIARALLHDRSLFFRAHVAPITADVPSSAWRRAMAICCSLNRGFFIGAPPVVKRTPARLPSSRQK